MTPEGREKKQKTYLMCVLQGVKASLAQGILSQTLMARSLAKSQDYQTEGGIETTC